MDLWIESSLRHLHNSAVLAFPKTTRRQHAVDPIEVVQIRLRPFLGMRTLFLKALVKNEDRQYEPLIVFKDMVFSEKKNKNFLHLIDEGREYWAKKPSVANTDVLVRCSCGDFKWRFTHEDYTDRSLYGRDRTKYHALHNSGSANPMKKEGLCKHLMKLAQVLQENGILKK